MDETSSLIQIKGIRDGLLVTLAGAEWPDLVKAFIENMDNRSAFFRVGGLRWMLARRSCV